MVAKRLIPRLEALGIIANKIHFAQGAQRHHEGHRWFGWGRRRYGGFVYFGSHYTATECANPKRIWTVTAEPLGYDNIDIDCRKR